MNTVWITKKNTIRTWIVFSWIVFCMLPCLIKCLARITKYTSTCSNLWTHYLELWKEKKKNLLSAWQPSIFEIAQWVLKEFHKSRGHKMSSTLKGYNSSILGRKKKHQNESYGNISVLLPSPPPSSFPLVIIYLIHLIPVVHTCMYMVLFLQGQIQSSWHTTSNCPLPCITVFLLLLAKWVLLQYVSADLSAAHKCCSGALWWCWE